MDDIALMLPANEVAKSLTDYLTQAIDRVYPKRTTRPRPRRRGPAWFDRECREKRGEAVRAGERAETASDFEYLDNKTKAYRTCKQFKKRAYRHHLRDKIERAFQQKSGDVWSILSASNHRNVNDNLPSPTEFFDLFYELSLPREADYFDYDYEKPAVYFLNQYDQGEWKVQSKNIAMTDLINDNFTVDEIRNSIRELKNNKSAGQDHIPAEFVKICSEDLADVITLTFNYMIEQREFPGPWALGQRTPVFKNGCKSNADNYRGITILSIFAKIF